MEETHLQTQIKLLTISWFTFLLTNHRCAANNLALADRNSSRTNAFYNVLVSCRTIDLPCPSKLLSFPTTFGAGKNSPQILCYSISKSAQLIDTKVGCLLTVEYASVLSNILLYVEVKMRNPLSVLFKLQQYCCFKLYILQLSWVNFYHILICTTHYN